MRPLLVSSAFFGGISISSASLLLACGGAGDAMSGSGGIPSGTGGTASGSGGASATGGGGPASGGAATGGSTSGGASSGGGSSGGTLGDPTRVEIFNATFTSASVGNYAQSMVVSDFVRAPSWNDGLDEGRAAIVSESDEKFLRVTYTGGQYGPGNGGVQFIVPLGASYDELYFSYKVRFASGFDFVKGGKLPGLVGGTHPTGCSPDPNGFSARNMWRTGGAIVQYVYWPNQPNTCGDDLKYMDGAAQKLFTPGSWQTVEHRVKMNTPGTADGILQGWVDGVLYLDDQARLWRDTGATYGIDSLYFSTFFGGGDASWAPASAQIADFDDLVVADKPITH